MVTISLALMVPLHNGLGGLVTAAATTRNGQEPGAVPTVESVARPVFIQLHVLLPTMVVQT